MSSISAEENGSVKSDSDSDCSNGRKKPTTTLRSSIVQVMQSRLSDHTKRHTEETSDRHHKKSRKRSRLRSSRSRSCSRKCNRGKKHHHRSRSRSSPSRSKSSKKRKVEKIRRSSSRQHSLSRDRSNQRHRHKRHHHSTPTSNKRSRSVDRKTSLSPTRKERRAEKNRKSSFSSKQTNAELVNSSSTFSDSSPLKLSTSGLKSEIHQITPPTDRKESDRNLSRVAKASVTNRTVDDVQTVIDHYFEESGGVWRMEDSSSRKRRSRGPSIERNIKSVVECTRGSVSHHYVSGSSNHTTPECSTSPVTVPSKIFAEQCPLEIESIASPDGGSERLVIASPPLPPDTDASSDFDLSAAPPLPPSPPSGGVDILSPDHQASDCDDEDVDYQCDLDLDLDPATAAVSEPTADDVTPSLVVSHDRQPGSPRSPDTVPCRSVEAARTDDSVAEAAQQRVPYATWDDSASHSVPIQQLSSPQKQRPGDPSLWQPTTTNDAVRVLDSDVVQQDTNGLLSSSLGELASVTAAKVTMNDKPSPSDSSLLLSEKMSSKVQQVLAKSPVLKDNRNSLFTFAAASKSKSKQLPSKDLVQTFELILSKVALGDHSENIETASQTDQLQKPTDSDDITSSTQLKQNVDLDLGLFEKAARVLGAGNSTRLPSWSPDHSPRDDATMSLGKAKVKVVSLPEGDDDDVISPSPEPLSPERLANNKVDQVSRQDRVVEQVKRALHPYYAKQRISKLEYKDILRKAVPKICSSKSEVIDFAKVKDYVEKYVMKEKQLKKYLAKKSASDSFAAATNGSSTAAGRETNSGKSGAAKKLSILALPLPKLI